MRLSAFLAGVVFAGYQKVFGTYLGMATVGSKSFSHEIELAFPHIQDIIDDRCKDAKK